MTAAVRQPGVPDLDQAARVARTLLADVGRRWEHVRQAGRVAALLGPLFEDPDLHLLVAAATLHDIGYSPEVTRTGFHPFDGAVYLRAGISADRRLASLVAHHSFAHISAGPRGLSDALARFPHEGGLRSDALVFADMHSSPDGRVVVLEERLADIGSRRPGPITDRRVTLIRSAVARVEHALRDAGVAGPLVLDGVRLGAERHTERLTG